MVTPKQNRMSLREMLAGPDGERAHDNRHDKRCAPGIGRLQDKGNERTHGGADKRARQGAADQAAQPGGVGN
jgi:hypothetical protein